MRWTLPSPRNVRPCGAPSAEDLWLTIQLIRHARWRLWWRRTPRSPRWRRKRSRRRSGLGTRPRSGTGRDPSATLRRLIGREHPYLAGDQEAQRFDGEPDPGDIGDDRDPFAPRGMLDAEVEIVPRGARESAAQLIVKPNLIVPSKQNFGRSNHRPIFEIKSCANVPYRFLVRAFRRPF